MEPHNTRRAAVYLWASAGREARNSMVVAFEDFTRKFHASMTFASIPELMNSDTDVLSEFMFKYSLNDELRFYQSKV